MIAFTTGNLPGSKRMQQRTLSQAEVQEQFKFLFLGAKWYWDETQKLEEQVKWLLIAIISCGFLATVLAALPSIVIQPDISRWFVVVFSAAATGLNAWDANYGVRKLARIRELGRVSVSELITEIEDQIGRPITETQLSEKKAYAIRRFAAIEKEFGVAGGTMETGSRPPRPTPRTSGI